MNKTQFTKFYSEILLKSSLNKEIKEEFKSVLIPFLLNSSLYSSKMSRERVKIIPRIREFGYKRKQKFLCLVEENGSELIVGKSKLIESLYPKKVFDYNKKHRSEVIKIMRNLVKDQITSYRLSVKKAIKELASEGRTSEAKNLNTCPLSGKSLNSCKVAVDHIIPFIKLVDNWMALQNLTFNDILIKGRGNSKYFSDGQLASKWQDYHLVEAKLQLTCSEANIKASSKGYKSYSPIQ